jgi:hypothetical protein
MIFLHSFNMRTLEVTCPLDLIALKRHKKIGITYKKYIFNFSLIVTI